MSDNYVGRGIGQVTTSAAPKMSSGGGHRVAHPVHVQDLERHLDLNNFIDQLEFVLSDSCVESNPKYPETTKTGPDSLNVKNVWQDESSRRRDLGVLYNFNSVGKRKWLKNILLEDSDSDSDADEHITDADIRILLKIHKYRRKYQKRYHTDIMNSQYTYYSAGLLSEQDRHPEHQRYIMEQYGFTVPDTVASTATAPVKKIQASKRRKSSIGPGGLLGHESSWTTAAEMLEPSAKKTKVSKSPSSSASAADHSAESGKNSSYPLPSEDKPAGMDPALKLIWKTIVTEDIPKAHTEKYIAKTYRSIVLKNIAMSCASFLQQAKSGTLTGKAKSRQRRQQKNEPIGLRPVMMPKSVASSSNSSS